MRYLNANFFIPESVFIPPLILGTNALFSIKNSYIILGGSRGLEVDSNYVLSIIPEFAKNATINEDYVPKNWELVKEIKGNISPVRQYNLKVYFIH